MMTDARIPAMPCPECLGVTDPAWACLDCHGTGRVTPNPLTAAEIAALPDGALVVVEWCGDVRRVDGQGAKSLFGAARILRLPPMAFRVWLADEDDA